MPKDALDDSDISDMKADSCGERGARKKRDMLMYNRPKRPMRPNKRLHFLEQKNKIWDTNESS